jgi:hypothetical protein
MDNSLTLVPLLTRTELVFFHLPKTQGSPNLGYLLNQREVQTAVEMARAYELQYNEPATSNPNLCFFLGDSSEYCTWSATSNRIPCFRMADGLFWFPKHGRFMVPADKMAALSMPTNAAYADVLGLPPLPVADRARCISHLGNCMHFTTVALIELIALISFADKANLQQ